MAEGFAVGGDEDSRLRGQPERPLDNHVSQPSAVPQDVTEGDLARKVVIEAEDRQPQGATPPQEWSGAAAVVLSGSRFELTLRRGKDREIETGLGHRRKRGLVDGTLRQPDALGPPAETKLEVFDSPGNLDLFVPRRKRRKNRMVVRLGDRVAVALA